MRSEKREVRKKMALRSRVEFPLTSRFSLLTFDCRQKMSSASVVPARLTAPASEAAPGPTA